MKCLFPKGFLLVFALAFFPVFPVLAENVSVMVIESGAGAVAGAGNADFWENGMMEVLFDAGHIVSNARSMRIARFPDDEFPNEALRDFQEAAEGGAEYFVLALLEYGNSETDAYVQPESISLRIYKINPYAFLFEKKLVGKPSLAKTGAKKPEKIVARETDDLWNVKNAAEAVISYIGSAF
jgi:hypothetical protein